MSSCFRFWHGSGFSCLNTRLFWKIDNDENLCQWSLVPPPLSEFVGKSSPLPSVCVPDVIGALVCGFQTQKIQKTPVSLSQALLGYLVTSPPSGCAPALSVWIQPPPKKKRLYTLVCVPDVFGWLTVWQRTNNQKKERPHFVCVLMPYLADRESWQCSDCPK